MRPIRVRLGFIKGFGAGTMAIRGDILPGNKLRALGKTREKKNKLKLQLLLLFLRREIRQNMRIAST